MKIEAQERELLKGYRQLKPESRRFIMSTVITAVRTESAVKRQYGFPPENSQERGLPNLQGGLPMITGVGKNALEKM